MVKNDKIYIAKYTLVYLQQQNISANILFRVILDDIYSNIRNYILFKFCVRWWGGQLMINLLPSEKLGYSLVSVRSQPYHTRPEAECNTAGLRQAPGRIPII